MWSVKEQFPGLKVGDFVAVHEEGCFCMELRHEIGKVIKLNDYVITVKFGDLLQTHTQGCKDVPKLVKVRLRKVK